MNAKLNAERNSLNAELNDPLFERIELNAELNA